MPPRPRHLAFAIATVGATQVSSLCTSPARAFCRDPYVALTLVDSSTGPETAVTPPMTLVGMFGTFREDYTELRVVWGTDDDGTLWQIEVHR